MRISIAGLAALCLVAGAGPSYAQSPSFPPSAASSTPPVGEQPTVVAPVTVTAPRPVPPLQPGPPRLELYEGRDYAGGGVILVEPSANLLARGFSDRARSARVFGVPWEVCNGPDFTPPCAVLRQDSAFLGEVQLSERVSSARPLAQAPSGR